VTPADPAASSGPIHTTAARLQAALAGVFPPGRFQHELLPGPLTVPMLQQLPHARAPFVGLAFLGLEPANASGRALSCKLSWGAYLVTRNPRHAPRLLGDSLAPGMAQMVHALVTGLHGMTIGGERDGGAGTVALTKGEALSGGQWNDAHAICWAQTLEVPTTFTAASPDRLLRLAQSWDFATDTILALESP